MRLSLFQGERISIPFSNGVEVICFKEAMHRSKTTWLCGWFGYNGWFVLQNNDYENARHFEHLRAAIREAEELELAKNP